METIFIHFFDIIGVNILDQLHLKDLSTLMVTSPKMNKAMYNYMIKKYNIYNWVINPVKLLQLTLDELIMLVKSHAYNLTLRATEKGKRIDSPDYPAYIDGLEHLNIENTCLQDMRKTESQICKLLLILQWDYLSMDFYYNHSRLIMDCYVKGLYFDEDKEDEDLRLYFKEKTYSEQTVHSESMYYSIIRNGTLDFELMMKLLYINNIDKIDCATTNHKLGSTPFVIKNIRRLNTFKMVLRHHMNMNIPIWDDF